jgi:pantoate--beta-alanine ligase
MKVFDRTGDLKIHIANNQLDTTGLVPTMGALHHGHITLVTRAIKECDLVTVSIFVNPTQFNDKNDLARYPRTIESDLKMLSAVLRENDAVFVPSVEEIYPQPDTRVFDFGTISSVMEGEHRPGHFNGVAQVVSRLFDLVRPDRAYFGQKDFQQLAVIRAMVQKSNSKVMVIGCPIIREDDGLAMSSRNRLLRPEHRKVAGTIYKNLVLSVPIVKNKGTAAARDFFRDAIEKFEGFSLQYFEVVDDIRLIPVESLRNPEPGRNYFICVALHAGEIRLIDNIQISLE